MTHQTAHKILKKLRDATPIRSLPNRAISRDGVDFNWKAHLACRMDKDDIIGPGIARVEERLLSARDPNFHFLKVPNRFDFLFHRIDGSIARVHRSGSNTAASPCTRTSRSA